MKVILRQYSEYKYAVVMDRSVVIPKNIRDWLLLKDSPFDESHVAFARSNKHIIAFEYRRDAYYFIAWMELVEVDILE